jgi:hypothetical protein
VSNSHRLLIKGEEERRKTNCKAKCWYKVMVEDGSVLRVYAVEVENELFFILERPRS